MTTSTQKKTIIITGASAGIGEAAARELAKDNRVVIVGRSKQTLKVAKELGVDYFRADYSDLASVRKLAKDLLKACPRIDFLINNAGGIMKSIVNTKDGFEQTFQVNYLAQFLLTNLLMDRLIASKGAVINTSSAAHRFARLRFDNIQFAGAPFVAYGNAKLLDLMHAQELARRFGHKGVDAVSFHPGVVATNFAQSTNGPFAWMYNTAVKAVLKTPAQGADTLVWLANNRPLWQNGGYYANRSLSGVSGIARDPTSAPTVWDITEKLL
ncbi:MAG TPA: SDR family NAD(P)-dependent oxidoreductase [Candidatus Microsaccharimonas sp.]|jgi:NAD(P)-dependent dehydrogenase (short-subunit alcohol dehydrogenase family)